MESFGCEKSHLVQNQQEHGSNDKKTTALDFWVGSWGEEEGGDRRVCSSTLESVV